MTQGHNLPLADSFEHPYDLSDDEQDISPSDGYFGANNNVPNTVLVPDPATENDATSNGKAREAAQEARSSGINSSSDTRYTSYTPATTYTPATSSRNSESAYNGSASRYRDSEDDISERSPLLEEPPPQYEDAMSGRSPNSNMNGSGGPASPTRGAYETMQVREPVSSFRTPAFSNRQAPQSMTNGVDDDAGRIYDEESDPVIIKPARCRRRGCCGARTERRKGGGRFRKILSLLLGTILVIWLIVHLAQRAHRQKVRVNARFTVHFVTSTSADCDSIAYSKSTIIQPSKPTLFRSGRPSQDHRTRNLQLYLWHVLTLRSS